MCFCTEAERVYFFAVAEKTKEQASQLGGVVLSGAGNIAAATGLMKKDEFPSDMNVRLTHPPSCLVDNQYTVLIREVMIRRHDGFLSYWS